MKSNSRDRILLLCCVLLVVWAPLFGDSGRAGLAGALSATTPTNIVQYVRDRFEIPAAVRVEAQPVRPSTFPHLYETAVTIDDGKHKRVSDVFITNDAQCFVMGNVFALRGASDAEIERCVRAAAKLPTDAQVTVGPVANSPFPNLLHSTVTVHAGAQVQSGDLYVTRDRQTGILGLVLPYRRDLVERLIHTRDQPSAGPASARVTIVEYSDLQCPACAQFQNFLEKELLPRYGSRIRVVFKEFPLSFHPWSKTAAIANECGYQIDPSRFVDYRTLIFANQNVITTSHVRDDLLELGDRVGLDPVKLGSCLDAEASFGRIESSLSEAAALGVKKTPTLFINGRIVIGVPPAQDFYAIVDDALAHSAMRK